MFSIWEQMFHNGERTPQGCFILSEVSFVCCVHGGVWACSLARWLYVRIHVWRLAWGEYETLSALIDNHPPRDSEADVTTHARNFVPSHATQAIKPTMLLLRLCGREFNFERAWMITVILPFIIIIISIDERLIL